jgi:hypothetical protein
MKLEGKISYTDKDVIFALRYIQTQYDISSSTLAELATDWDSIKYLRIIASDDTLSIQEKINEHILYIELTKIWAGIKSVK